MVFTSAPRPIHHPLLADRLSFNSNYYDVQNYAPANRLALDTVTIRNQHLPFVCDDEMLSGQAVVLDVEAGVCLGVGTRGIHMSRIERAYSEMPQGLLAEQVSWLAQAVRLGQDQAQGMVTVTGSVPIRKTTPITGRVSVDQVRLEVSATSTASEQRVRMGLGLDLITACPCMQRYALDEMCKYFGTVPDSPDEILRTVPVATHSQKAWVVAALDAPAEAFDRTTLDALAGAIGRQAVVTHELLKRPDEYEIVRRAHLAAKFIEDVVRDVAAETADAFAHLSTDDTCAVEVSGCAFESVHGHDVAAGLRLPLREWHRTPA